MARPVIAHDYILTFPDQLVFASGAVVDIDDVSIDVFIDYELDDLHGVVLTADVPDSGTVINHLRVELTSVGPLLISGTGSLFEHDEDEYDHPDDVPYDSVDALTDNSVSDIEIELRD